MKPFRTFLFWLHLACGIAAGLVILIMSATGALLGFKPQIVSYIERDIRTVKPPAGLAALGMHDLLTRLRDQHPDAQPMAVTVEKDPATAVAVTVEGNGTLYLDPYSGHVLGEGSVKAQSFFRSVEDWHRYLAAAGDNRTTGKSITDACNLAFLVLATSGPFLWWPRRWLPQHVKAILWFRRTTNSRARDFNWHNVIGFWCAPVLIVLTLTAVIMSYPWANNLLYRMTRSPVPAPAAQRANAPGPGGLAGLQAGRGASGGGAGGGDNVWFAGNIDRVWARAALVSPNWRVISMRTRPGAPVAFTITDGPSWNAFARSQLTVDGRTAEVVRWDPYAAGSLGQKMRQWARFSHTGELGGLAGQTAATLACLGGVFLVWTGFALGWRRLVGWKLWNRLQKAPRHPGPRKAPAASAASAILD